MDFHSGVPALLDALPMAVSRVTHGDGKDYKSGDRVIKKLSGLMSVYVGWPQICCLSLITPLILYLFNQVRALITWSCV